MTPQKTVHSRIKQCPCCGGQAEWVDVTSSEVQLWQLSCIECGMATNLEKNRYQCLHNWNRRRYDDHTKTMAILVVLASLFFIILAFIIGLVTGFHFTS